MKAFYRHYDDAQRVADIKVTMAEFVKDVPSIVSFMREDLFAHNNDLKNYRPNSRPYSTT